MWVPWLLEKVDDDHFDKVIKHEVMRDKFAQTMAWMVWRIALWVAEAVSLSLHTYLPVIPVGTSYSR